MVVAGFAGHAGIDHAHEVANEVRRISKQLKECQALAQIYNTRERLFGIPVTNVRESESITSYNLSFQMQDYSPLF